MRYLRISSTLLMIAIVLIWAAMIACAVTIGYALRSWDRTVPAIACLASIILAAACVAVSDRCYRKAISRKESKHGYK